MREGSLWEARPRGDLRPRSRGEGAPPTGILRRLCRIDLLIAWPDSDDPKIDEFDRGQFLVVVRTQ